MGADEGATMVVVVVVVVCGQEQNMAKHEVVAIRHMALT